MFSQNSNLFWKWKKIYNELLDPVTTAVESKYLPAILENELNYCKTTSYPISIAILKILSLPTHNTNSSIFKTYTLVRNIIGKIQEKTDENDLIFYDGIQTFSFLFPNKDKTDSYKLLNDIEIELKRIQLENKMPILLKGGFAEFPSDADNASKLQECAYISLINSNNISGNKILGHFNERRKFKRAPAYMEVRYKAENSCERLTCSRNISEEGIMLNGLPDLPLGNEITLKLTIPNTVENKIILTARTIWNSICSTTGKMGIGLYFTDINYSSKEQIRKFVSTIFPPIVHL